MEPREPELVLMRVEGLDGPPGLAAAAEQLGVEPEDVDPDFGVVLVDPARGLYCVQVRADRLPDPGPEAEPYRGPFGNPRIAPFHPGHPPQPPPPEAGEGPAEPEDEPPGQAT